MPTKIDFDRIRASTQEILQSLGFSFQNGRNLLCPFHEDHHPSLSLNLNTKRLKCFASSCGWSGDIIDFVQQYNGLSNASEACKEIERILGTSFMHSSQSHFYLPTSLAETLRNLAELSPKHHQTLTLPKVMDHFQIQFQTHISEKQKEIQTLHYRSKWLNLNHQTKNGNSKPRWIIKKGTKCNSFHNLENLPKQGPIYIVNGEWALFALYGHTGMDGLCPMAGEGQRNFGDLSCLQGREVTILFDHDGTGTGADFLASQLYEIAASVKTVYLFPNTKDDLEDWFHQEKSYEHLLEVIATWDPWTPAKLASEFFDELTLAQTIAHEEQKNTYSGIKLGFPSLDPKR